MSSSRQLKTALSQAFHRIARGTAGVVVHVDHERHHVREKTLVQVNVQEHVIETAAEPVEFLFRLSEWGRVLVVASVRDGEARLNSAEVTEYVYAADSDGEEEEGAPLTRTRSFEARVAASQRAQEERKFEILPNKETYAVGDEAQMAVHIPIDGAAEGVLLYGTAGIERRVNFKSSGAGVVVVPLEVQESFCPSFFVTAVCYGEGGRRLERHITCTVDTATRRLGVEVLPAQTELYPGAVTSAKVRVTDHLGPSSSESASRSVLASTLNARSIPGHTIAALRALKSSLLPTTGGDGG